MKIFGKKLFREKFAPSLINLHEYEKNLLYDVEHWREGSILRPVAPPPGRPGGWTESEDQAMDDNRAGAKKIYEKYEERVREDEE
ncbi:MAG: hypothetical protein K940chlam2_01692 [Chlamydiae bacterium]|nr:hypothetical protein [Chlamydiota bacterium]